MQQKSIYLSGRYREKLLQSRRAFTPANVLLPHLPVVWTMHLLHWQSYCYPIIYVTARGRGGSFQIQGTS